MMSLKKHFTNSRGTSLVPVVLVLGVLVLTVTGAYVYTRQAQDSNPEVVGTEPTTTPTVMENKVIDMSSWKIFENTED